MAGAVIHVREESSVAGAVLQQRLNATQADFLCFLGPCGSALTFRTNGSARKSASKKDSLIHYLCFLGPCGSALMFRTNGSARKSASKKDSLITQHIFKNSLFVT